TAGADAAASDTRRGTQGSRGPLEGIPVLLKDNIDTADREHSTAGSFALVDSTPTRDAFLVGRLRAAGAVIVGKANLSEWANFRSTRSISGWSARGGQTHNPYVLDRNPCGSSSGSAVAASAHLAAVTIGTETDGSIMCPSGTNSVVGIKPTLGLVSRSGVIPISAAQDTAGRNEQPALLNEFKHDINAYLAARPGPHPADLAGLIAFDTAHAAVEMPLFQQEIFQLAQSRSGDLTDPTYLQQRNAATSAA